MDIKTGESYIEKGSKFLGFVAEVKSVDEFKSLLNFFKTQHKRARHVCYAYTINEDGLKEKYSSDGEPNGCGNALISLLKHNKLENYAIVVVRYFGGVLLGSGNLVRAYSTAGKNALKQIV